MDRQNPCYQYVAFKLNLMLSTTLINDMHIQISTSVLQENTPVALMPFATIPRDRTTAHANLDISEMDELAKVSLAVYIVTFIGDSVSL